MTRNEYVSKIDEYILSLRHSEKSDNTISKYHLGIRTFMDYADVNNWDNALKDGMLEYKKHLENKYELSTANLYIIALNSFLKFIGKENLCLKTLKIQEQFNNLENSFSMDEYSKMSFIAEKLRNKDTYYIMLALASTGIRISELQFMTVDALNIKGLQINNKGKVRFLPLSERLCNVLLNYCQTRNIQSGCLFR